MKLLRAWRKPEGKVFAAQLLVSLVISAILTSSLSLHLDHRMVKSTYLALFACNAFAAILCLQLGINILLRLGSWTQEMASAFMICLACLGLHLVQSLNPSLGSAQLSALFVGLGLLLMTWASHELMTSLLDLQKSEKASLGICVAISLLAPASWELRSLSLQGIELTSLRLARWTFFTLSLYPGFILLIRVLSRQQKKDYRTKADSEAMRISSPRFSPHSIERLFLPASQWLFALINLGLAQGLLNGLESSKGIDDWLGPNVIWAAANLQALPSLIWVMHAWSIAHRRPRHIRSQSVHNMKRAASLLEQHHYGQSGQQETWLGYRTAVLMIDHDPNEECRTHLPSFLYRARQLQCEQIIQKTFGEQITSFNSTGSQLTIAVDPERTMSSCTEALLILTVLYLDGLPLIEKRLKQLVRLMPLLDPELGRSLSETRIEALFSHLQGFFHLDYSWIDQSMQSDAQEANIEIRLENLNPRERHRVLAQLSAAQWLGNFIWISESARDQLRSESPFLASTIERWPIQLEQSHGRSLETAIFLIKFENLIPRLQRYFGFDLIRARLAPLPIDDATQALLDSVQAGIGRALDFHEAEDFLLSIQKHSWQGFRAKDLALDLIVKLVNQVEALRASQSIQAEQLSAFRRRSRDLVLEIGYPSQELHAAHMRKLEIRQLGELQRICVDVEHPRCYEAWLLLASLPVRKMGNEGVMQLLELVATVACSRALRRQEFILNKAVETYFQLARSLSASREAEMQKIMEQLAVALLEVGAEPRLLLSFMDKKLALDQQRGQGIGLSTALLLRWDKAISERIERGELTSAQQSALNLRWKSFRQNISDAPPLAS